MSISTGVCEPRNCCAVCEHGHPRRGEPEPLVGGQVRVVGDDARDVGLRVAPTPAGNAGCAKPFAAKMSIGCTSAERLVAAVGPVHTPLQFERLAVVERAVLLVVPDRACGGDCHQRAVGGARRQLVPGRGDLGRDGVLVVAAHHRGAFGIEAERKEDAGSVDAHRARSRRRCLRRSRCRRSACSASRRS